MTVRAFDPTDPNLPTGKQVGWYTPTSGIWQTVWLESHPKAHIGRFAIKTTIDPARASAIRGTCLAGRLSTHRALLAAHRAAQRLAEIGRDLARRRGW